VPAVAEVTYRACVAAVLSTDGPEKHDHGGRTTTGIHAHSGEEQEEHLIHRESGDEGHVLR
jgi:hypothetical protein